MISKNSKIPIWSALAFVFLLCVTLWYAKSYFRHQNVNYTEVTSENGYWDLTEIDFETTVVYLTGSVSYIEDAILTPLEFEAREDEAVIGQSVDTESGRTAKLIIEMPDDGYYNLFIRGDYARSAYINGEYRGTVGTPATTAEDFKAAFGEIDADTKAYNNIFELIISGGNFVHQNGSSYSNIIIGSPDNVSWFITFQTSVEILVCGMLFVLFIIHLMMALIFGNKRLNLCFSAVCLLFSIRLGLVGNKVLYEFAPDFPWEIAFRAEYITMILSSAFLLIIIYLQFNMTMPKKSVIALSVFFIFGSLYYVFADTFSMSKTVAPLNALQLLTISYIIISIIIYFIKLRRTKQTDITVQVIAFIAVICLFYAVINDILYYSNIFLIGVQYTMIEFSILIFSLFEAIAIFHTTTTMLNDAKIAEQEAKGRVASLALLNKMKTEFLQDISHEMKTPLTVIRTGAEHAKRQLNHSEIKLDKTNATLDMIEDEATRLSNMVGGMVDMANMKTFNNRTKTDFNICIESAVNALKLIAKQSNTTLEYYHNEHLPFVFVDPDSFSLTLSNIITNAIRHTKNGSIKITTMYDSSFIAVYVRDNGVGIKDELLPNVLRRGVSYSNSTGLGLYICKSVIESHGGSLKIESTEGRGTTVSFTIPVYGGQEAGH